MYAIVDIETTGGYAESNGITEIAIYVHDGRQIVDSFCTLIDPGRQIPSYIEGFTGITNAMVEHAPSFDNVAHTVFDLLHDKVFVAHNVNFDHSFISNQLSMAGYQLNVKKLCTVRYSRKIFPGLASYSLGNICAHLGISINDRHRAGGDAEATVKLFELLLEHDDGSVLNAFLKRGSKEYNLPANLPKESFEGLPESTGVYYFHDEQGRILYIGKAVNIKKRVTQHFTGTAKSKQKQDFMRNIHDITYTECATELMALILESIEIKQHWPSYNRAQKHREFPFGIYTYEDQNGYMRMCIDRIRKGLRPTGTYRTMTEAMQHLQKTLLDYELCPKLCQLDQTNEPCAEGLCHGACRKEELPGAYNARAAAAIDELSGSESFAIVGRGTTDEDISCVLVEKGMFYGMGMIPSGTKLKHVEQVKEYIAAMKANFFIRELLDSASVSQWGKKVILDHS